MLSFQINTSSRLQGLARHQGLGISTIKLPERDHKTEGKAESKPLFPSQSFALARFYPVEAMTIDYITLLRFKR